MISNSLTGDFGTFIVHDRVETDKTATVPASTRAEESSPATGNVGKPPVSGLGDKAKDSRYSSISFIVNADIELPLFTIGQCHFHAWFFSWKTSLCWLAWNGSSFLL